MSKIGPGVIATFAATFITGSLLLNSCTTSLAQTSSETVKKPSGMLANLKPVKTTQLTSDSGLPVEVGYFNVEGHLKAISYRLALEYPKTKGWKHTNSDEMAVFTCSNPDPQVKWQRIALFKGRVDKDLKQQAGSAGAWTTAIVYRVKNSK
jgi:hypothetical protein